MSTHSFDGKSRTAPPSFTIAHTGYQVAEVQRLLDDLAEAANSGEALGPIIERRGLGQVSFGYATAEVDAHLARLMGGPPPAAGPAVATGAPSSSAEAACEAAPLDRKEPNRDRILHELSTVRFRMSPRSVNAYEVGPVDDVLDQLESRARTKDPITDLIDAVRLPTVSLGVAGYTMADVDDFLDHMRALGVGGDVPDSWNPDDAGSGVFRRSSPFVLIIAVAIIALVILFLI